VTVPVRRKHMRPPPLTAEDLFAPPTEAERHKTGRAHRRDDVEGAASELIFRALQVLRQVHSLANTVGPSGTANRLLQSVELDLIRREGAIPNEAKS
jgi:hypothetical protein